MAIRMHKKRKLKQNPTDDTAFAVNEVIIEKNCSGTLAEMSRRGLPIPRIDMLEVGGEEV